MPAQARKTALLHFARVRLSGFKSFVDPTELVIEPGLTGIVGPNGCGKSNLVEALRWVMGETSAKQMRGGEMDDVIFAGTPNRPPRNIAEVQLCPRQRRAQGAGRVQRAATRSRSSAASSAAQGSSYRVNGREVRARDVQLLFADAATGARSTALVSQGRIGALINAKPTDRRALLEEAAGITGLHSRRHEAELRLRAAETNLDAARRRAQTLESQLAGLEAPGAPGRALPQSLRPYPPGRGGAAASALARRHSMRLETAGSPSARPSRWSPSSPAAWPPRRAPRPRPRRRCRRCAWPKPRSRPSSIAYAVARDALEAEERRTAEATAVVGTRLEQIAADTAREESLKADAAAAAARLAREADELAARQADEAAAVAAAVLMLEEANAALAADDAALDEVVQEIAAGEAREVGTSAPEQRARGPARAAPRARARDRRGARAHRGLG